MENKDKPAFGYGFANEQSHQEETGLTKREEFARSAMQGLLSCHGMAINKQANASIEDTVAHFSIRIADELLKQLEK